MVTIDNLEIPEVLELRMRADPRVLSDIRRSVRRWLHRSGVDEQTIGELTIAVSEACANAVEHAYSAAPAEFDLHVSKHDGSITASVRDAGRWRAPRGENRGRGLVIINAVMDDVEVRSSDAGTEVVMHKRLPTAENV